MHAGLASVSATTIGLSGNQACQNHPPRRVLWGLPNSCQPLWVALNPLGRELFRADAATTVPVPYAVGPDGPCARVCAWCPSGRERRHIREIDIGENNEALHLRPVAWIREVFNGVKKRFRALGPLFSVDVSIR